MNTADIQNTLMRMRHEEPERYYALLNELAACMEGLDEILRIEVAGEEF